MIASAVPIAMRRPLILTLSVHTGMIGHKDADREEYAVYAFRERPRCIAQRWEGAAGL